jgi:hypothetical protein
VILAGCSGQDGSRIEVPDPNVVVIVIDTTAEQRG